MISSTFRYGRTHEMLNTITTVPSRIVVRKVQPLDTLEGIDNYFDSII